MIFNIEKIILTLLVFVSHSRWLFPQTTWEWQNPLPQGGALRRIMPMTSMKAIAVGSAGTVMSTQDGGENWQIQRLEDKYSGRRIAFRDSLNGWVLGLNKAFKTEDGGTAWQEREPGIDLSTTHFQDIQFTTNRRGWILTDHTGRTSEDDPYIDTGNLYQTTDRGDTWSEVFFGASGDLLGMSFADSLSGFILSENRMEAKYYIFRTLDGGETWDKLPAPDYLDWAIHFSTPKHGWVAEYRTVDGGITWQRYSQLISDSLDVEEISLEEVTSVFFVDSLNGWMTATYSYCLDDSCFRTSGATMICHSVDGGQYWTIQKYGIPAVLEDIRFLNRSIGWSCGYGGLVYHTTDGGERWIRCGSGTVEHFNDVDFVDSQTGWAVGNKGVIYHTDNAGQTWVSQVSGTGNSLAAVDFVDRLNGWIVGEHYLISHTADGGENWEVQYELDSGALRDVCFVDEFTGWAVGNRGTILHTKTGGLSWEYQNSNTNVILGAVHFVDEYYGWASGKLGTILKTRNGGATWESQNIPYPAFLRCLQFVDRNHGWVADGESLSFYRTENGGSSWTELPMEQYMNAQMNGIWSFYFIDQHIGWASSFLWADIATTANGGQSWNFQERLPAFRIHSLHFINNGLGWAVGSHGSILRYSNPNLGVPINSNPGVPFALQLAGNFPNPFNVGTTIYFDIQRNQSVGITLYNLLGEKIADITNREFTKGLKTYYWMPGNLASGTYFIRINCDEYTEVIKCTLVR